MHHLLSIAVLLMTLAPQQQNLPAAFYQIPKQLRERATVVVTGEYGEGISPCIFMPDGSRRRALESWFNIKKVYLGEVGGKTIWIKRPLLPNEYVSEKLKRGPDYLVLLRPDSRSMETIKTGSGGGFWDALQDEEIIAIVELNGRRGVINHRPRHHSVAGSEP